MAKAQAIDGRQALCWYLEPQAKVTASTDIPISANKIIVPIKKASTTGFPSGTEENKPFIVAAAITLKQNDEYVELKPYFIGMAKDKSVNKSKNTTDVTVDFDAMTNNITDGQVSISGSISLMYSVDGKGYANTFIKQRFGALDLISVSTSEGNTTMSIETLSSKTDEKDLILFAWNARDAKTDDIVEFEIVPVLITSMNHSSSYGSSQSMDINFTGNAEDENGYKATTMQISGGKTVVTSLATTRADAAPSLS